MQASQLRFFWQALPLSAVVLFTALAGAHPGHMGAEDEVDKPPKVTPLSAILPGGDKGDNSPKLSAFVSELLQDPVLTEAERRSLAIFHGQWEEVENPSVVEQARIALRRYDLKNPALFDVQAEPLVRAEAALYRGEPQVTLELLADDASAQAAVLRSDAHEQRGEREAAIAVLVPWRDRLGVEPIDTAAELVAATEALVMLARLEGRPAEDYHLAMSLLGKTFGELDRLYWPAHVAEAKLLLEKGNPPQAAAALNDALTLNPNCSQAWHLLGLMAVGNYNFEQAEVCIKKLRAINSDHPLADMLAVEMYLTQRDPDSAQPLVDGLLKNYPTQREALALSGAVAALHYDTQATRAAVAAFDALAPGNPLADFTIGRFLSMARQYRDGEAYLRSAIAKSPNWPAPHLELGLLLMQSGDEAQALAALRVAGEIDPFHVRVNNQLKLVTELLTYHQIETQHFIVKYHPGRDEVLARDMAAQLETIYDEAVAVWQHRPRRKTLIEIMPDSEWFAVRITGMPWIWTIGACTGDVIALTPPKVGRKQKGAFDWDRVIRHEYVHTVTLDQTNNRIPHWYTEACAVSQEPGGRDYNTCKLLADALEKNKLFTLADINWGFIRPKAAYERPLAYAQAHWMLQYITQTYGHQANVEMLELYKLGTGNEQAVRQVTGEEPAAFLSAFKAWAARDVASWGLGPQPKLELPEGFGPNHPEFDAMLAAQLEKHPQHPDLLQLAAQRALTDDAVDYQQKRAALLRYHAVRPVDPWTQQALASLALAAGRGDDAIAPLSELDRMEQQNGAWAHQLAVIYRAAGELEQAAYAADRALHRDPYNGTYRELAAAINLQRGDTQRALHHLIAMPILEPDRAVHQVRLAFLYGQLGEAEKADAAARAAMEIEPDAPVGRFLIEGEAP